MHARLRQLRPRTSAMLESLEALVAAESPSTDPAATDRCADVLVELGQQWLSSVPHAIVRHDRRHLCWRWGRPRVLLLGHLDTVWPLHTLDRWPFDVADGKATGPGVFDMKGGLVQGFAALASMDDLDGVSLLVTCDEEIGSPSSRALVEELSGVVEAVLVLEPSAPGGALKIGRKGVSLYRLQAEGRAAHAGLDPGGPNALLELAHQLLALPGIARPDAGTDVAPTVAQAGTASNVIPATAWADVDVRVATAAEQERVDLELRRLTPAGPGTRLTVTGGPNRPPLERAASAPLFGRAVRLAAGLGLAPLDGVVVGGASDGNFSAALGVPTLDGLGGVGDGAHAEGEHVVVDALAERAALVAELASDLLARGPGQEPAPSLPK